MYVSTDLHGHSLYSDARFTPGQLVSQRAKLGMKVVALSDHDVFTGVRAADSVARGLGVVVVPAAEVTSVLHFGTEDAEQIHVLAYFPPSSLEDGSLERSFLFRRGQRVQARWKSFVLEWLGGLSELDRLMLSGRGRLDALPEERFPALQPFLDVIAYCRAALADDFRRHHVRFWTEDRELFGWSPEEMIDAIRADGALDVVAHAVRYQDKARLERILDHASGIEVYTSRHNERVAARFRALAEEKRKHWTASSDDHQRGEYVRPPCGTPLRTVERILGRAVPREWWIDEPAAAAVV